MQSTKTSKDNCCTLVRDVGSQTGRKTVHNGIAVAIAASWIVASLASLAAGQDAARWRVEAKGGTVTVTDGELYVGFRQSTAWTMARIKYRDKQLVGPHGSQGTVLTLGKNFVGTGHGGEVVHRFFIRSDGKEYEPKEQEPMTFAGREIAVIKESTIGPFHHVAEILFPETGEGILYRYRYRIDQSLDEFGRMYAFMHCVENDFKNYLAVLPDSSPEEGQVDKEDGKFVLKKDVKAVVYYSKAAGMGMAFVYPEVYLGAASTKDLVSNMIWDRKNDNKLYFNAAIREKGYGVGDEFEYRLKFIPFTAEPDQWKAVGLELAKETGF